MRNKAWGAALIGVLIAGAGVNAASPVIVPGEGIPGLVTVGEKRADALASLGTPIGAERPTVPDMTVLAYPDLEVCFAGNPDIRYVSEILIKTSKYRTAKGVRVGSTFADVVAEMGDNYVLIGASLDEFDPNAQGAQIGIQYQDKQTFFYATRGCQTEISKPLSREALELPLDCIVIRDLF